MEENFTNEAINNEIDTQSNSDRAFDNEYLEDDITRESKEYYNLYSRDREERTEKVIQEDRGSNKDLKESEIQDLSKEKEQQKKDTAQPLQQQLREYLTNTFKINKKKCDASECTLYQDQNTLLYQYKDSFIFSNSISLIMIMALILISIKHTNISKLKGYIKEGNLMTYFSLLMIALISASSNMPTYFINNYKTAIYINQGSLFIIAVIFMIVLRKKKSEN